MMSGRVARRLCLGAALSALCAPAAAQTPSAMPNFGSNGVYREDPASALGRYLRMVTANPRNLEALTGAGRAALDVGDAQAAIGFFARAEAISPRNGRIKAGLGSALVLLNQEQAALRYFDDAVALGVPEADIASDRGLAYDLRGSAKRAQRDYALALKRGEDPETTRRMALSLAIGGEKQAALTLLDPLLRRQDTAAWRARAFILAMSGDAAGASRAAESVMSPTLAAGFVPFFRKLPSLRPGEKAAAVHFGNFPGEGRPMRIDDLFNQAEVAARVALENSPRSATDAGQVDASQSAFGRAPANAEGQVVLTPVARAPDVRIAAVATPRPLATAPVARPYSSPVPAPSSVASRPVSAPVNIRSLPAPVVTRVPTPAPTPAPTRPISTPSGPTSTRTVASSPAPVPLLVPSPAPTPAPVEAPVVSIARSVTTTATIASPVATPIVASPGFGSTPSSASTAASETPRLADISATVREVAREPLVRDAELPPSSLPPAELLPVVGPPTPPAATTVGSPVPDAATSPVRAERLADVARVLASPGLSNTASPMPPPSLPNVETSRIESPLAASARSATPAPVLNDGPRVEAGPPLSSGPKYEPVRARAEVAALVALPKSASAPLDSPVADDAERMWVQVAGGADERAFPSEWRKLRAKAPDLLADRTAWTTPLKATNRLLVGPFADGKDAQGFVNRLGGKGITAFPWASAKGQPIARLSE